MSVYKFRYSMLSASGRGIHSPYPYFIEILLSILSCHLCSSFLRHGKKGLSMKMSARVVVFDVAIFDINWDVRLSMQQEHGNTLI